MDWLEASLRGLDSIGWASDSFAGSRQDVRVNHRGLDVVVAEQLLDRADVAAGIQQVCREGVAVMPGPA